MGHEGNFQENRQMQRMKLTWVEGLWKECPQGNNSSANTESGAESHLRGLE